MKLLGGQRNNPNSMRVVLDTNVLVSAFLWQRSLKTIHDAIRTEKITPCFTEKTFLELKRTLYYEKFKKQLEEINITPEEIIKLLASKSYFVTTRFQVLEIKEDPSDNHFLACALSCGAHFIVSGDRHLLSLKIFRGIPITTPRKFLSIFSK